MQLPLNHQYLRNNCPFKRAVVGYAYKVKNAKSGDNLGENLRYVALRIEALRSIYVFQKLTAFQMTIRMGPVSNRNPIRDRV